MTKPFTVTLNFYEVLAIRRGLKRLSYETHKSIQRNDSAGWTPEEGKLDRNREHLKVIKSLLDRPPFSDYPDDIDQPQKELP